LVVLWKTAGKETGWRVSGESVSGGISRGQPVGYQTGSLEVTAAE